MGFASHGGGACSAAWVALIVGSGGEGSRARGGRARGGVAARAPCPPLALWRSAPSPGDDRRVAAALGAGDCPRGPGVPRRDRAHRASWLALPGCTTAPESPHWLKSGRPGGGEAPCAATWSEGGPTLAPRGATLAMRAKLSVASRYPPRRVEWGAAPPPPAAAAVRAPAAAYPAAARLARRCRALCVPCGSRATARSDVRRRGGAGSGTTRDCRGRGAPPPSSSTATPGVLAKRSAGCCVRTAAPCSCSGPALPPPRRRTRPNTSTAAAAAEAAAPRAEAAVLPCSRVAASRAEAADGASTPWPCTWLRCVAGGVRWSPTPPAPPGCTQWSGGRVEARVAPDTPPPSLGEVGLPGAEARGEAVTGLRARTGDGDVARPSSTTTWGRRLSRAARYARAGEPEGAVLTWRPRSSRTQA